MKSFIDNLKVKPAISIDSKSEIKFPKTGSSYFIGTAGQKAFGRGDTVDRAHLSEAAFYNDLERIRNGIEEAAEYGQVDIETTPNGRDQVYDLWQKAKQGKSSYTPIFIPWFIDGEYSIENMTEKEKQGLSVSVQKMFAVPDAEFLAGINDEEKRLVARVAKEWNILITAGQLKWRRYKIWDKGEMFYQEYPEDDVSCFLQSGRTVFSKITLDITRRIPLDDFKNWKADDRTKKAFKNKLLFGGIDAAEGTPTGDAHNFSVIDVPTDSKIPAAVIFEITSNEPIDHFAERVRKICDEFSIALGVEKNGVGVAMVQKLRDIGVGFTEWETTGGNRPVMITSLEEAYRKGELVETYPDAENEARDMEYKSNNRAEHKTGKHDDRVFGRAIAWQMRSMPEQSVEFL